MADENTTLGDTKQPEPVLGGDVADNASTDGDSQTTSDTAAAPSTKAELKYELNLPEGYRLHDTRVDEIAAYAKEQGLSNDVAQDFLNTEHAAIEQFVAKQEELNDGVKAKWIEDLKDDKNFGGDKYNKTVELAKRAFTRFATETLREELNSSGYGNHPELIKTFARIGELMSDDSLITQSIKVKSADKTIEQILYPDM